MRNRIVMMFAIFIVIYIVIHIASQSAVFSTYPGTLNTAPVNPPIVLQDPGVSGVSVSLGVAGASANVTILLPYSLTISQDVIYYTTFDSGIPSGWATYGPGTWGSSVGWVSGGVLESANGTPGWPNTIAAYYTSNLYSSSYDGYIYLAAYVSISILKTYEWAGIAFHETDAQNFYACAIGNNGWLEIVRGVFIGGRARWTVLNGIFVVMSTNKFYLLVCVRNPSTGAMLAQLYDPSTGSLVGSISFSSKQVSPTSIGLVVRIGSTEPWISAVFDELVVAYNDPRAVYVDNVPSGWVVRLYNGTVLLGSATSAGARVSIPTFYGTANSHNSTILRSGRIEVYDDQGNLRASRSEVIVTGRVYYLQPQGFDNHVLNVVNVDLKGYYGLLSLRSPASYSGFSTLQLYLCNPSTCSTALDIIAGSTSTSEIVLPDFQISYIRLVATPSASGASANIQIWLQYSTKPEQNAAVVRYPINIAIR
jgi:hypothetical protein